MRQDPTDDPQRFPPLLLQALGFAQLVRFDTDDMRACVKFEPRSEFTHSGGTTVQGGFIAAWLDNAMAFALAAGRPEARVATLELKTSFLGRVALQPVFAEAWIRRVGRSVAFMEAELRDSSGTVLATATSTCRIV